MMHITKLVDDTSYLAISTNKSQIASLIDFRSFASVHVCRSVMSRHVNRVTILQLSPTIQLSGLVEEGFPTYERVETQVAVFQTRQICQNEGGGILKQRAGRQNGGGRPTLEMKI